VRISASAIGAVPFCQLKRKVIRGGLYVLLDSFYANNSGNQTRERMWYRPSHVACLPANVEGNVFVLDHVSVREEGRQS
jgi:hypothetical protein